MTVLAPHNCLVCGDEGNLICNWCKPDAFTAVPPRCYRCRKATVDSRVCFTCRRQGKLTNVWAVTDYDKTAQDLIYKLKFERAQAAADLIAEYLHETLPYLKPETLVTFAPTANKRRRERGYDQAELIAKALARKRGLRFAQTLIRAEDFRQTGARRDQRLKQLSGAFWSIRSYLYKKSTVLIIDDVLTTGATLQEAAKTLKQAGAKQISAAVFAQTL